MAAAGCSSSVATNTGGAGGNTGGGGSGGSGGNGGAACSGYEDQEGVATVTFHFRNDTLQSIFLVGNCGAEPHYQLSQVGGGEDATSWGNHDNFCLQTCERLQTEGQVVCDACAPSVIQILPGKSLDVKWDGTGILGGFEMPAACYAFGAQDSCSRIIAAPQVTWSVTATAFSECQGETCTCQPDGTCWGVPTGQQANADITTFSFPSQTLVDVVFSACAFGCPDAP